MNATLFSIRLLRKTITFSLLTVKIQNRICMTVEISHRVTHKLQLFCVCVFLCECAYHTLEYQSNLIRDCIIRLINYREQKKLAEHNFSVIGDSLLRDLIHSNASRMNSTTTTTITKLMSKCIHVHTKKSSRNCNHHVIKIDDWGAKIIDNI